MQKLYGQQKSFTVTLSPSPPPQKEREREREKELQKFKLLLHSILERSKLFEMA